MDAEPALRSRRRMKVAAVLVFALLVSGATVALVLTHRHSPAKHPARHAALPTRPTPSATVVPAAHRVPVIPHDDVPAARPTSFELSGPRFTIKAHVCSMPPVFPLDPPGEQHHTVCWVTKGFGVRPGSSSGTSYVLGHSWAEDDQEVLNKASAIATRQVLHAKPRTISGVATYPVTALNGYRLTLHTRTGTLVYTIRDAYGVDKQKLGNVRPTLDAAVRNRVVVITCAQLHGRDYDYNIVLDAYLYSSKLTRSAA